MIRDKWEWRVRRADELAAQYSFATEVLDFYKHIVDFQRRLYAYFQRGCGDGSEPKNLASLLPELDLALVLKEFPSFLTHVRKAAPAPITQSAGDLTQQGEGRWRELLTSYWKGAPDFRPTPGETENLLAWIFLQSYAEYLADHGAPTPNNERTAACPFCGGRPLAGVLRPEGDGAKRSLICSLCATEWPYRRIVCPACGEETVEKLAIYTTSQFPEVRVEACDTCRYYIKTIDLTKNGRAVPVVDELATIPLNLWAQEHQYVKLQPNLLGI